jgi:hypothetical protein
MFEYTKHKEKGKKFIPIEDLIAMPTKLSQKGGKLNNTCRRSNTPKQQTKMQQQWANKLP